MESNDIKAIHGILDAEEIDVSVTAFTPTRMVRGLRTAGAGIINVDFNGGNTDIDIPMGANDQIAIPGLAKINTVAAGTTATGIVALY